MKQKKRSILTSQFSILTAIFILFTFSGLAQNDTMCVKNRGTINNIVIFISFSSDTVFTNSYEDICARFNDTNTLPPRPSLRKFMDISSYGKLDVISHFYPTQSGPTVISYIENRPFGFYEPYSATNTLGYQNDDQRKARVQNLYVEALLNLSSSIPADLDLDHDDDGFVDNVTFMFQDDLPFAIGPSIPSIYMEHGILDLEEVEINGKVVRDYVVHLDWGLNLQDYFFYNFFQSLGAKPIVSSIYNPAPRACIMSIGDLNVTPPCAYTRYMCNWLDSIPLITEPGTYILDELSSDTGVNLCYRINSSHPDQYYIVEYRQEFNYFSQNYGMKIYRIDTRFEVDEMYDLVNTYPGLYLFRENGRYNSGGTVRYMHYQFNRHSNPYPFLSEGIYDGLSLSDIHVTSDNKLYFTLDSFPATHTITVNTPYGGQIFPAQDTIVNRGDSITLQFAADPNFRLVMVKYDDREIYDPDAFLTINPVLSDHVLSAYYVSTGEPEVVVDVPDTLYFNTTRAGPSMPQRIQFTNHDTLLTSCSITTSAPFEISLNGTIWNTSLTIPHSMRQGEFYLRLTPHTTTAQIERSCSFANANADPLRNITLYGITRDTLLTLTSSAGIGGTISPLGITRRSWNTAQIYQITPDRNYRIESISVNNELIDTARTFTIENIKKNYTIHVEFEYVPNPWWSIDTATRYFESTPYASSPSQYIAIQANDLHYTDYYYGFTFTTTGPFEISSNGIWGSYGFFYLNGGILPIRFYPYSVGNFTGTLNVYLDGNIIETITLQGTCRDEQQYTIAAYNSTGGTISPYGVVNVDAGGSQTFSITPELGYKLQYLLIDEELVVTEPTYTFSDVSENHTIYAFFENSSGIDMFFNDLIKIYPNPVKNKLHIEYGNEDFDRRDYSIEIIDIKGKQLGIYIENIIDVSNLAPGIYFIRIQNGKESVVKKMVKE